MTATAPAGTANTTVIGIDGEQRLAEQVVARSVDAGVVAPARLDGLGRAGLEQRVHGAATTAAPDPRNARFRLTPVADIEGPTAMAVRGTVLQDQMRARFGVTYDEPNIAFAAGLFASVTAGSAAASAMATERSPFGGAISGGHA